ncbi:MAG TPA: neutral zinc metallopeptidase, partial [Candidatus Acidoferrum sp.]|nr:neutral zinc metallopeptidase [Candidatus Acidoferrum sp.]
MRWTDGGESSDIEDRRDESGGGGGGGFGFGGIHIGLGGALILLVLSLIFHQNFFALLGGGGGQSVQSGPATSGPPNTARDNAEKPLVDFISFVLDDVQKTWTDILPQQSNRQYHKAKLVLFRNYTQSGCGNAESATGPFYCPSDQKVYIDLGFYDELKQRFGAPGQFAQAYVLAHEVGHHVQNILGIERQAEQGS